MLHPPRLRLLTSKLLLLQLTNQSLFELSVQLLRQDFVSIRAQFLQLLILLIAFKSRQVLKLLLPLTIFFLPLPLLVIFQILIKLSVQ